MKPWLWAWLLLCAGFYLVHIALWLHNRYVIAMEPIGWFLKPIGNLVHVLTLPGWLVARLTLHSWGESDLVAALLACAIGLFAIIIGAMWLMSVRRLLAGNAKPDHQTIIPESDGSNLPTRFSRRKFLTDGLVFGSSAAALSVVADAACIEPARLRLQRYTVAIRDLPREFEGLRLAQLTDTHLGPRVPAEFIDAAIRMAIGLQPDVFLLTGDYVHCGLEWIEPATRQFFPLVATGKPVVGVLGNHDWFNDGSRMSRSLSAVGVRMIDNDRVFLSASGSREFSLASSPVGPSICIGGLGDLRQHHIDPERALAFVDPRMPRLVIAHNPDSAEESSVVSRGAPRIDLMICGHTHGGQVRIPGIGTGTGLMSQYGDRYSAGLVQGPKCLVLISRGIGISLVPFRFLVPPEVVEITLTRSAPTE
ncbi:MAG: metallophosphoesterase [Phycisphaeraceae bacterium]|nr:metallophosphoesterase [Phycisphaeraceae bacterium]